MSFLKQLVEMASAAVFDLEAILEEQRHLSISSASVITVDSVRQKVKFVFCLEHDHVSISLLVDVL